RNLYYPSLKRASILVPPRAEQDRIVAFLDEKTAQIDALIAKKQRQIELLDEQRGILINRAVTRGIGNGELRIVNEVAAEAASDHSTFTIQNSQFKDSGITWIGPIPKHWELKRVKHCSLYFTSGSRGWGDYYADSGDAFLQSGDLTDNCAISLDKVKRVKLPRRTEGLRTRLESHDTVVCITGANTGRVANVGEVQETIFVNQHLCLVRPSKSINPQYLSLALSGSAGRTHFTLSQYGLKEGLNLDDVKNCLFPLPPIDEQAEILAYIQGLSKSFETTIAKVESQIQTLQTLRSTLIAHAVTGKIAIPAATA
ncbi:MAG: restriction endonuclease subunit S, partial [Verrucomicrobiaceae bacterium]